MSEIKWGCNMFRFRPMMQYSRKVREIAYNGKTIGESGCALLSCANAYRSLTGKKIDINDLVKLANANNCAVSGIGTRWKFIFLFAEAYNLQIEIVHDVNQAIGAIKSGAVGVVSAHNKNKQIFTTVGHWMAIVGADDTGFLVYDPQLKTKLHNPNARTAIKSGLIRPGKRAVWVNAEFLASEVKPEFPEPKNCESFTNMPFGAAILRINNSITR
jgi:hypothetical protein